MRLDNPGIAGVEIQVVHRMAYAMPHDTTFQTVGGERGKRRTMGPLESHAEVSRCVTHDPIPAHSCAHR